MSTQTFSERRAGASRFIPSSGPCSLGRCLTAALAALAPIALLTSGCSPQTASSVPSPVVSAPPAQAQPQAVVQSAPTADAGAPGEWGAFNGVLRSGGVYKNSSGKYLKLTFAPLSDSLDAIFADAPSGSVTITNAKGDRAQGTFSLERDRTLTVTPASGKKLVFEMSGDGRTLTQIGGGQTLKLQP